MTIIYDSKEGAQPYATNWNSLLGDDLDVTVPVVKRAFDAYNQTLLLQENPDLLNGKRLVSLRRIFRNIYMESNILDCPDQLQTLCQFVASFGEDFDKLFGDIKQIFESGYKPYWIFGFLYIQALMQDNPSLMDHLEPLIEEPYDGEIEPDKLLSNKLLGYRWVCSYYLSGSKRAKAICDEAFEALKRVEAFFYHSKSDGESPSEFDIRFYHVCNLTYNSRLRLIFVESIKNADPSLKGVTLEGCIESIISNKPDSSSLIDALARIQESTSMGSFALNLQRFELKDKQVVRISESSPLSFTKKTFDKFITSVIELTMHYPLPKKYRLSITPRIIEQASANAKDNHSKALIMYTEILQWLYSTTGSFEDFKQETITVAYKIHQTAKLLFKQARKKPIKDTWEQISKGKLSSKQLDMVVEDLSIESVRLIRQVMLKDINPKLEAFEHTLEGPAPVSESGSSESVSQAASSVSSATVEVDKTKSVEESDESQVSELEWTPRTELTLSSPVTPRLASESMFDPVTDFEGFDDVSEAMRFFNNCVFLTVYTILDADTKQDTKNAIKNFLTLADKCVNSTRPNLHIAYAIYSALQHNSVSRISYLFDGLSSKYLEINERLNALFSPLRHHANYRMYVRESRVPVIPCLETLQKELRLVSEEDSEAQQLLKKRVCDEFHKMQHLLKVTYPLRPFITDCVNTITEAKVLRNMKAPPKKVEGKIQKPFMKGEWESLSIQDKLYFVSSFKWNSKSKF